MVQKSLLVLGGWVCFAFLAGCPTSAPQLTQTSSQVTLGSARFTIIDSLLIRVEFQSDGIFVDQPTLFAAHREARFEEARIEASPELVKIDTGKLRLTYHPTAAATGFNSENLKIEILSSKKSWDPSLPQIENLGGTASTLDRADGPIPVSQGLLSRQGWYVLDDSKGHVLTTDGWIQERKPSNGTDWYFFGYDLDYKSALKAFTRISGQVPLPRKYTMGSWYSRYWPYRSDEFREIVGEYSQNDFPLDGMVMDMDWHLDGWTGYTWNRDLLPDAESLLKWFHNQGLAVTLNDHPCSGVGPQEEMYSDFMRAMGVDPRVGGIEFDAGNQKYLETFFKYTHEPREREGVDFWWLDWQQEPFTRSIPTLSNLSWLNEFYYRHSEQGELRGQALSRWGGWGDHRHPIHFSGDASTSFKMLEFEIPFTANSSNVGLFYWSHDMGGHMGGRNEESFVRWVQFGSMSAVLRLHSTRDVNMDRRPWTYSREALESMKISFHLRSQLFPYIYSSAWQGYSESLPLVRPMYYEYPRLSQAYQSPAQYLFGDSILVAPITQAGVGPKKIAAQKVWFPPGADWFDYFTGERFSGGQTQTVQADLNRFPLYFKGGAPIVMQAYSQRMTTAPLKEARVRIYPGELGQSTLYEDDGMTKNYEQGERATTSIRYQRQGSTVWIEVDATQGSFKNQLENRSYVIEMPESGCAQRVFGVEGARLECDSLKGMTVIHLAERSVREPWRIQVDF